MYDSIYKSKSALTYKLGLHIELGYYLILNRVKYEHLCFVHTKYIVERTLGLHIDY